MNHHTSPHMHTPRFAHGGKLVFHTYSVILLRLLEVLEGEAVTCGEDVARRPAAGTVTLQDGRPGTETNREQIRLAIWRRDPLWRGSVGRIMTTTTCVWIAVQFRGRTEFTVTKEIPPTHPPTHFTRHVRKLAGGQTVFQMKDQKQSGVMFGEGLFSSLWMACPKI